MQGDGGNDTYRFDPSNDLTGTPRTDYVVENSDPATDDDTLNFTGYVEPVVTGSSANQLVAGNLTVTIANGATIADVVGPSVGNVFPPNRGTYRSRSSRIPSWTLRGLTKPRTSPATPCNVAWMASIGPR